MGKIVHIPSKKGRIRSYSNFKRQNNDKWCGM